MDANKPTRIVDGTSDEIVASVRRLACERGYASLTVRDVLKDLHITNRVFYNRFANIDEVLDIVYRDIAGKVRESLCAPYDGEGDFFEHVHHIAARTLHLSYVAKQNFNQFVFEADSAGEENFAWWDREIRALITQGKQLGVVRADLDEAQSSYAIWCFIRGFNADALGRDIPENEALARFRYGFDLMLSGMRA